MQKGCDVLVSDNKELVEKIREQLKQRGNHCPCKLIQNEDTLCPCKEFDRRRWMNVLNNDGMIG